MLVDSFRDHLARMVHESNWQEGVYLDFGKTKELAGAVFSELGARTEATSSHWPA